MGPIVGNSESHQHQKEPREYKLFHLSPPIVWAWRKCCERPSLCFLVGWPARLLNPGDGSASRQKYMLSTHDPTLRHA